MQVAITERERQIIHLISEGLSNKEIGRQLNVCEGTIKIHLHHIFQKLAIHNRSALAALAVRESVMAELAGLSANQAAAELNRRKIATASGGQ